MRFIISIIQRILDFSLGIGYGTSSINKEISSFHSFIPNGRIFVDVGGNKGLYTEAILKRFSPHEVHIFEPSKTNIEVLNSIFL